MVMRECKRQVSFLIAEKSMHQKGIGFFARMVNASKCEGGGGKVGGLEDLFGRRTELEIRCGKI